MDILDIDEILKDDSFCLLEDKNEDDVSNILQQWRNGTTAEQGKKFDSRTFTRPKRKPAQTPESQTISNNASKNNERIDLKIGGLVTSMQKSFLYDVSPPTSICSSVDMSMSIDKMNNSLITSADFANVSFLKSAGAEGSGENTHTWEYTLDDIIRDTKAIESLTLSGESTLIKDYNIAQTDELYLSKTNSSSSSTMHNSTDSIPYAPNETYLPLNETVLERSKFPYINEKVTDKSDDLIVNTTFNLADSIQGTQILDKEDVLNATVDLNYNTNDKNETFNKYSNGAALNTTYEKYIKSPTKHDTFDINSVPENMNLTFDCLKDLEDLEAEKNSTNIKLQKCKTPEKYSKESGNMKALQSTPHHKNYVESENEEDAPAFKHIINDVAISPITAGKERSPEKKGHEVNQICNKTFEELEHFLDKYPQQVFPKIENYNIKESLESFENKVDSLSCRKSEEEFDTFLEDFVRYSLAENAKMRQSLDSIKKRHSIAIEKHETNCSKQNNENCPEISSVPTSMPNERLLSRRSRLYDNIEPPQPESPKPPTPGRCSAKIPEKTDVNGIDNISNDTKIETSSQGANEANEKVTKTSSNHDRERFKTIRITRRQDCDIVIPCIDNELEQEEREEQNPPEGDQRFSRRDKNSSRSNVNNKKPEVEKKTYTPSKIVKEITKPTGNSSAKPNSITETPQLRSLSKPRYFEKVQRELHNEPLQKVNSAGSLGKVFNLEDNRRDNTIGTVSQKPDKRPLGTKAKSFHNLTGNFGFSSKTGITKPSKTVLPSNANMVPEEKGKNAQSQSRIQRASLISRPTQMKPPTNGLEKPEINVFKAPPPVNNLPPTTGRKTGLMRPSSGFYSYNTNKSEYDIESGRYSSNNSLSSGSSKGSLPEIRKSINGHTNADVTNDRTKEKIDCPQMGQIKSVQNKSNIPKPSGIKPPGVRKSALPRPSSLIRR